MTLNPVDIKKILAGLEYLDDGTRIVDLDLIWKDEKVDWPQLLDKDTRGFTKIQVSNIHRKKYWKS
ncbi:MAG: hypothetical protein PWR06_610 [Thermoanaerobacteraceae bacterium]|jgi:hypothetical protein|nr:hypothetical protein [Thermoanaerobacteraceae bacterium]RKL62782.1 hypothetical protein DXT63_10035 [Thermoanaerobacteraceae bacterium SP2]